MAMVGEKSSGKREARLGRGRQRAKDIYMSRIWSWGHRSRRSPADATARRVAPNLRAELKLLTEFGKSRLRLQTLLTIDHHLHAMWYLLVVALLLLIMV